jgi:tetratricopeptide (TPR) repeat protein
MIKKIITCVLLGLVFIYSCSEKGEKAEERTDKSQILWDGQEYPDAKNAVKYLSIAIEQQQKNAETYNKRGLAYYTLGQYQRTIEDNSEAIRLKPDYFMAYNNRSVAYAKLGKYKLAIADCDKVISMKPDLVNAYINRGTIYFLQGNKEIGCRDYKKACELGNCKSLEEAKARAYCR